METTNPEALYLETKQGVFLIIRMEPNMWDGAEGLLAMSQLVAGYW